MYVLEQNKKNNVYTYKPKFYYTQKSGVQGGQNIIAMFFLDGIVNAASSLMM